MPIERKKGVGGMETFVLRAGSAEAEVVPERGALVTRFRVEGENVLYLDEATLADRSKNVRGGIPVLFPIAGKLPHGTYAWDGATYELPQHGFARTRAWTPEIRGETLVCMLASDAATRVVWPFDFEASLSVAIDGECLNVALEVANRSRAPMPFHAGFHPYFAVPDAAKSQVLVNLGVPEGTDNQTGQPVPAKLDLRAPIDAWFRQPGSRTALTRPGLSTILVNNDDAHVLVVWNVPGKDFLCLEPWNAPGGTLATAPRELPLIAPGASATLRMGVQALPHARL